MAEGEGPRAVVTVDGVTRPVLARDAEGAE
jgi:hypothetical protein